MRISLVSCNVSALDPGANDDSLRAFARFVAEENISCVLLQFCRQSTSAARLSEETQVREGNPGAALQQRLSECGVRFELHWCGVRSSGTEETGCAVLSQLPVLEYTPDRRDTVVTSSRAMVVRIALGVHTVLDAYTVCFDPDEKSHDLGIAQLLSFVDETPELLAAQRPPRPKRRGPVRNRPVQEEHPVETRVIAVGATTGGDGAAIRNQLAASNYADLTTAIREIDPHATTDGSHFADFIFLKPAIRAQSAGLVFTGEDAPRLGDRSAVVVHITV